MTANGSKNFLVKILSNFFYMQHHYGTNCTVKCWRWNVSDITMHQSRSQVKYAVLVLNRPLTQSQNFLMNFWNNAFVRLTVDGGTTHWDKYISNLSEDIRKTIKMPDLITGDFDSISDNLLEIYRKKGCKAIHTPDQAHTDFTKALMELNIYCHSYNTEIDHVVALAQSSGRIDQVLGNIQTLFLAKEKQLLHPETRLYIMSDDALSWLLYPGNHVITIPNETRKHRRAWCSLVPIGETCQRVKSTGLKWNLGKYGSFYHNKKPIADMHIQYVLRSDYICADNEPLKFGETVSTSNAFDGSEKVTIKCSHPLLWSMRIPSVMD